MLDGGIFRRAQCQGHVVSVRQEDRRANGGGAEPQEVLLAIEQMARYRIVEPFARYQS